MAYLSPRHNCYGSEVKSLGRLPLLIRIITTRNVKVALHWFDAVLFSVPCPSPVEGGRSPTGTGDGQIRAANPAGLS